MAKLDIPFDSTTVEVSSNDYAPLPAGWYDAKISEADVRNTKAGTGQYIAVRYDIIGPTHQGRVVWQNLNISNPNPKAEEIGREQLAQLMTASGIQGVLFNTDQLIGGELSIKLTVRKSEEYGDSNDVKGCKSLNSGAAAMPASSGETPAAPASSAPPWQK